MKFNAKNINLLAENRFLSNKIINNDNDSNIEVIKFTKNNSNRIHIITLNTLLLMLYLLSICEF